MLSNTPGLQRRSCALGPRRDAVSRLSRTCPTLRKRGRCRAHEVEERARHAVVAAKQSELHARATALYTLQRELLSSSSAAAPTDESTAAAAGNSSDNSDDDAATAIARLVDELKREPAYMHWNVEAEVEAQLVAQHVRRCPYAHRHVVDVARKRPRHEQQEQQQDDSDDSDGSSDGSSDDEHTRPRRGTSRQWDSERRRVFADMTPLQQCVVALLWQRSVCVPRRWLCDVHDAMTDAAEAALRARMTTTTSADNADSVCDDGARDELLDAYVQSDAFAAAVARAGDAAVRHVTCCPALGLVDVSALPQLVACITQQHSTPSSSSAAAAISSNNNKRVHAPIITHATWSHFVATASSSSSSSPLCLFARALSEKEVDLSNDAVAAELVEVLAWMLHVFAREGDDGDGNNARASIAAAAAETPPTTRLQHARSASSSSIHNSNSAALSWRMLVAQRCQMRSADGLVSALHKRRLAADLLALDLSSNHLTSLRFLFALRAYCAQRLLRLSLRDNAITRKPEYVEQVRRCLPRLTSLDGRPIRRPALRLPRPCACACSLQALCRHDDNDDNDNVNNDTDDAAVASMCVRKADALRPSLRAGEAACVVDCVARLLYIWETRRVPHTAREVRAAAAAAVAAEQEEEEELHEDNFWHRYLHPSATLTFSTAAQWSPYDAATMRTERDVDNDNNNNNTAAAAAAVMRTTYGDIDGDGMHDDDDDKNEHRGAHGRSSSSSSGGAVMVLSAADVRDVRIFDVAMRAGARNLLAGRAALSRVARGARDCFTAYQCTLYPPSLRVCHHLRAATMAVHKLVDNNNSSDTTTMTRRPTLYLVTLHGVMTWQLPSMRAGECIAATYDRTMTFVVTQLPRTAQRAWERRRSPPLQLYSDHVLLRPCSFAAAMATAAAAAQPRSSATTAPPASPSLSGVVYSAQTRARVLRLTIEFGLEACDDGVALVCAVVERCTSDAAEHAALDALVYGPPAAVTTTTTTTTTTTSGAVEHNNSNDDNSDVEVVPAHVQRANAAVTALLQRYMRECRRRARAAKRNDNDDDDEQDDARVFRVYSLLDRTASSSSAAAAAAVCGVSALHALLPPLPDMPCNNSSDACKATATTTLAHDDNNNNNGSNSNTPRTRRTLTTTSDGWGATLHRVPMRLVNAVTRVMNAHYTLHACTRGAAS